MTHGLINFNVTNPDVISQITDQSQALQNMITNTGRRAFMGEAERSAGVTTFFLGLQFRTPETLRTSLAILGTILMELIFWAILWVVPAWVQSTLTTSCAGQEH